MIVWGKWRCKGMNSILFCPDCNRDPLHSDSSIHPIMRLLGWICFRVAYGRKSYVTIADKMLQPRSTAAMTLAHYKRAIPERQRASVEALERRLAGKAGEVIEIRKAG